MSNRLLMAAAVVLAGMTSLVSLKSAQAATTTATFNGSVAKTCVFGTPTTGSIGFLDYSGDGLIDDSYTGAAGGQHATVAVTCNDDYNVTLHSTQITTYPAGFVAANGNCFSAVGVVGGSRISQFNNCASSPTQNMLVGADQTVNSNTLQVEAGLYYPSNFPAGNYTYQVQVDATPN